MKPTRAVVMVTEVQLWLSEIERKYDCEVEVCCWVEQGPRAQRMRVVARAKFPPRGVLEGRTISVEEAVSPALPIELGAVFLRQAVRLDMEVLCDPQVKFWSRELGK